MRAPVSYNTVTAVWTIPFSAVADDRVIRNADPRFVDDRQSRAGRLQTGDAIGQTFRTSRYLHQVGSGQRVHHGCGKPGWQGNQADPNFSDSIAGQIAAAMRSTNKDNLLDPGILAKLYRANN